MAVPVLLAALCAFSFCRGFHEGTEFVMDAVSLVEENPRLRPVASLWELVTTNYWGDKGFAGLYRPVSLLSFRWDYQVFGFEDRPQGYVGVNLFLHILVTLLLWRLALRWVGSAAGALITALIFAVHPLGTSVVPNIVGRADLLAALFILSALLAWERVDGENRGALWAWVAALLWLLGMLSKENAVAFIGVVLLRDAAAGRWQLGTRLVRYAQLGVAGMGWLYVRHLALRPLGERDVILVDNPLIGESLLQRLPTALAIQGRYLMRAFVPTTLSADYSFNQIPVIRSWPDAAVLVSVAVLAGSVAAVVLLWRNHRCMAVGILFYFGTLFPVSNLLVVVGTIMADRLLYLPLAGLCICLGAGGHALLESLRARHREAAWFGVWCAVGIVAITCVALTFRRTPVWRDQYSLWTRTAETSPNSVKALVNLASALDGRYPAHEDLDRAIEVGERAVQIVEDLDGEFLDAHATLGALYTRKGNQFGRQPDGQPTPQGRQFQEKAVAVLTEAAQRDKPEGRRYEQWVQAIGRRDAPPGTTRPVFGHAATYRNLGAALNSLGRFQEAARSMERAVAIQPMDVEACYHLGLTYANMARFDLAEKVLTQAVHLRPGDAELWRFLGLAQLRQGRWEYSVQSLVRSLTLDGSSGKARRAFGHLRGAFGGWIEESLRMGLVEQARQLARDATRRYGFPEDAFRPAFEGVGVEPPPPAPGRP